MELISDEQVRDFRRVGYFVTEPMWEAAELRAVAAECDRLHAEHIADVEANRPIDAMAVELARHRPFIGAAHLKSSLLADFVKSPIYIEACAKLIGPDADLYYNQVVIKPPEKGHHFGWHQDSGYGPTEPLEYITCWTAISRTFVDNGCVWLIPGSHRRGLIEHRRNEADQSNDAVLDDEAGAIPVEMEAGQVAIFSSLLLHRSGQNVSTETRCGFVPQYHHADVASVPPGQALSDGCPVLRAGRPVDTPE